MKNGHCYDGNLRIYTFDPPQDHHRTVPPPDSLDWQAGNELEPENMPTTKISKLLVGDVVLTCHRDLRGKWIAERAVVEQVICYRCQFDECRMTSLHGFRGDAAITFNHRILLRQGTEPHCCGRAPRPECWENAEGAEGARTTHRAQQYVYNIRIGSPYGIVAEGGAILATLNTPQANVGAPSNKEDQHALEILKLQVSREAETKRHRSEVERLIEGLGAGSTASEDEKNKDQMDAIAAAKGIAWLSAEQRSTNLKIGLVEEYDAHRTNITKLNLLAIDLEVAAGTIEDERWWHLRDMHGDGPRPQSCPSCDFINDGTKLHTAISCA